MTDVRLLIAVLLCCVASRAYGQEYVDPPVSIIYGTVLLPFRQAETDSPKFRSLGLRSLSCVEIKKMSNVTPDSILLHRLDYGRNGARTRLYIAAQGTRERQRVRTSGTDILKQVVWWKPSNYPRTVRSRTRYRYKNGKPVRSVRRGTLVSHEGRNRQRYDRRRHISKWRYHRFGIPGEKYSSIFQSWSAKRQKYAHEDAEVWVYDSSDRILMGFTTRDFAVDGSNPEAAAQLDSLLHHMPSRIADIVTSDFGWDEDLPESFYQEPATDSVLFEDWKRSADSLLNWYRFCHDGRMQLFDRLIMYDYSPQGRQIRRVHTYFNGGNKLQEKDTIAYDEAGRITHWGSWEFRSQFARSGGDKRDSGTLRHRWLFSYDAAGRVDSAVHEIWHDPPGDTIDLYHKATEHFAFSYDPHGFVAGFRKGRQAFDGSPEREHRVLSTEQQEFRFRYEFFRRKR